MPPVSEFEFRPIESEERPSYDKLVNYVFANSSKEDDSEDDPLENEWTTAAFHKGKIVATSGGFPFKMRLNGNSVFADGLTNVGTEPGYRRRGLVRELVTRRLQEVHEHENQSVSILWASMAAIYQRFGYGLGSTHTSSTSDPRYTMFQFNIVQSGHVRNVEEKEGLPIIKRLYREFIEDRTLDLHRADVMWKNYFGDKKSRAFCAIYYDHRDTPQGYVSYRLGTLDRREDDPGPDQRLTVRDFIYKSIKAYRGLWEFIRAHDLVGKVHIDLPRDDPAMDLLLEPRMLNLLSWDGLWLRVVDAETVLRQRNYVAKGAIVLRVRFDKECPWNNQKFLVDCDGEYAEVSTTELPEDVTITPNGLASLITGNSSLTQLFRVGRAEVEDPAKLAQYDSMFATKYLPFCRNGF